MRKLIWVLPLWILLLLLLLVRSGYPADFQYSYGASDEELYQTDLYGGTDADLDNTTPVDATDGYTSDIDLTTQIYATIDFRFDASGTTDDLVLTLYGRRDSTWDGDEIETSAITVTSDGSEDIYSYELGPHKGYGPGHYRFALQSSGATDTIDIDVQMRRTIFTSP
jgi:hypothetical protein